MVNHMAYIYGSKHHPARWDLRPEEGGWVGVKVVCGRVSKVSKPSDGDEEGKEGEESRGRET